eukprot:snap_masked-scaffold_24-processed-gene-2.50-mRNA-1 protein AED:1.00 eAED:1.00 QI:0/0/0/0/1/1/2/0/678
MSKALDLGDKLSHLVGAPISTWTKRECQQMKMIHETFRKSKNITKEEFSKALNSTKKKPPALVENYSRREPQNLPAEGQFEQNAHQMRSKHLEDQEEHEQTYRGKDSEEFLYMDSPLRSVNGEGKAPANCPWKDQFAFEKSKLRVKGGKVPFRRKREHLTPLSLMLHEFKLWATNNLANLNIYSETSFHEIAQRKKYVESVVEKSVWGGARNNLNIFGAGINETGHKQLFTAFISCGEKLENAYKYAKRQFSSRESREKLKLLTDGLRSIVDQEITVITSLLTVDKRIGEGGFTELQPINMLDKISTQHTVDYGNIGVICYYKLLKIEGIKNILEFKYEPDIFSIGENFNNWNDKNLFIIPSKYGDEDLLCKFDNSRKEFVEIVPSFYSETVKEINKIFIEKDPKRRMKCISIKSQAKKLSKAFSFYKDEDNLFVRNIMKYFMKVFGSLQNLIPMIYLVDVFHHLSGTSGSIALYDDLKEYVIDTMVDIFTRVQKLYLSTIHLKNYIQELSLKYKEIMQDDFIKKKKGLPTQPTWISNYKFVEETLFKNYRTSVERVEELVAEISHDAWYYELSKTDADLRKEIAKDLVEKIVISESKDEENMRMNQVYKTRDKLEKKFGKQESWVEKSKKDIELDEYGDFETSTTVTFVGYNESYPEEKTLPPKKTLDPNYDSDDEY